jgi:hypothetical protein
MSGRGGATNGTWDGIVPPECAPSERILRLSPALRWEEAREPLHAGIDVGNVVGIGPGMPFAHAVLAGSQGAESVVGLVPCAQGGTPIANWSRGTELYERMVTRARAAGAECSGRGELAGMLWFQGEADTMRREDAELYRRRMETLVHDGRGDLGRPDLLVIQVTHRFSLSLSARTVRSVACGHSFNSTVVLPPNKQTESVIFLFFAHSEAEQPECVVTFLLLFALVFNFPSTAGTAPLFSSLFVPFQAI